MALSGSFSGSIKSGHYKLKVDWSATQSVANNTSKITAVMYLVTDPSWDLYIGARSDNTCIIAGTSKEWSSPEVSNSGGKTTKLGTVTSDNITHNADGTKSVTISATFYVRATISGTYYEKITASATVALNTIPRATTPKLSVSSAYMGTNVTISTPGASTNFTHDLAYSFNGAAYVSIATGIKTSKTWTVPDLATSIPKSTYGTMTIRCITKNGSTTIGTKTVLLTAKVPESVIPTIVGVTLREGTPYLAAQFGAFIQNKSTIKASIAGSGAKGSTVVAYQSTLGLMPYAGSSWTSEVLTASGIVTLKTRVQDSRGRWSDYYVQDVTVLPYTSPKIIYLEAYRCTASGSADDNGEYLNVQYKYSVEALGNKNTAKAVLDYKKTSEDESAYTELATDTSLSSTGDYLSGSAIVSTDYQYDVRLTLTDWFGKPVERIALIPSDEVVFDIRANGKGIAFGKTAEHNGVDFGWDIVGRTFESETNREGVYQSHDGMLMQWGQLNITPTAANTPTVKRVDFGVPFAHIPAVFLTPVSSTPQKVSAGTTLLDIEDYNAQVNVVLTSEGTATITVYWLALGRAADT